MTYVIACGDEGVQLNEGTRLAVAGAGLKLEHADQVYAALKQLFSTVGIAASEENDWVKQQFQLDTYEQADATMQQYAEAAADEQGLTYVGFIPFADPQELQAGVKAHMVRPKGIHIANKICFTLAGGEQTYNLGQYLISAEWVHAVDKKIAKQVLTTQVEFYTQLAGGRELEVCWEEEGELDAKLVDQNKKLLADFGFAAAK